MQRKAASQPPPHVAALRFAAATLFDNAAAGVLLSGDSGAGKSYAMQVIARQLIDERCGLTLIDPHGDLAGDIERYCAALPPSQQRRVIVIRYADTSRVTGLNPLAVERTGDDTTYRARVASRVGHVVKILLHAFGERDLNGKPVLAKWLHRYLTTLALAGLTIPDVRHFFDVRSPVYEALTRAAPDFVAQLEMEQLASLRPADREEQIGSTKNRCLNFLENPVVELVLGKPDGHLDLRQAIRDRAVIIVSLERGGVLRDEDVEIFANLWLHEILYAVYNTPRGERVPHFLMIDELPTFGSSFEVMTSALAQVRKFLCRFIVAFQGTQLFEDREQDRLLNALIGQCNVQFYFRHKHPIDARFFADLLKLPSIETRKVKHTLRQLQQYQDGHDLVTLTDTGTTSSDAEQDGGSAARAVADTQSTAVGASTTSGETHTTNPLAEAVSRARSDQSGTTRSDTSTRGTTETDSSSWSRTKTHGASLTHKQTLVPRIRTRQVVSAVQFYTTDEQFLEMARELTRLPRGTCLLYMAGGEVARVRIPELRDPHAGVPRFAAKKLEQLRSLILARDEFDTLASLKLKRIEFEQRLIQFLYELPRLADSHPTATPLLLPESAENGLITI